MHAELRTLLAPAATGAAVARGRDELQGRPVALLRDGRLLAPGDARDAVPRARLELEDRLAAVDAEQVGARGGRLVEEARDAVVGHHAGAVVVEDGRGVAGVGPEADGRGAGGLTVGRHGSS